MLLTQGAQKNQSMLEDDRMKEERKFRNKLKQFKGKLFPPIGHVYSVMVEELGIEKHDFKKFINDFNKIIEIGGCGYARIKDINDYMNSKAAYRIRWYLEDYHSGESEEVIDKIVTEAYGGYRH